MDTSQNPWAKGGRYWPGWDENKQGYQDNSWKNKETLNSSEVLFSQAGNEYSKKFGSVEAFNSFLRNKNFNSSYTLNLMGGLISSHFRFYVPLINFAVNVYIKLDPSNKDEPVKEVISSDEGVTFFATWQEDTYDTIVNGNEVTIILYGYINYNLFLEGIGTLFSEKTVFEMKVDIETGQELYGKVIE